MKVELTPREASTLRYALTNYRALLRELGRPENDLGQEALTIARRLWNDTDRSDNR